MTMSRVWREGMVTGLLGAGAVAGWFFLVDVIGGRPLYTPDLLGRVLIAAIGYTGTPPTWVAVSSYTLFHVAAFLAVGAIATRLVELSRRAPHVTIGLLLFFVVFEAGFYLIAMVASHFEVVGNLAWYQIGAANLLAAVLMGGYLWRRHPELKSEIKLALEGRV